MAPAPQRPRVSVALPTHRGRAWLRRCLLSLAEQTLARDQYEVVVVVNGPDDGSADLVRAFTAEHPDLAVRLLTTTESGYARAVNLAIGAAAGEYLTMVDDDDTVSRSYLAALLDAAAPDVVSACFIADLADDDAGPPDLRTPNNRALLPFEGRTVHPREVRAVLSFNVCKMVPTRLARAMPMREDLRLAPDIVFWHHLVNAHRLSVRVVPASRHAVYYRRKRAGSHSRPLEHTWETGVRARLDTIAALLPIATDPAQHLHRVSLTVCKTQARAAGAHLRDRPDEHPRLVQEVRELGLPETLWPSFNKGRARDLAVAYVFPPANDTSGLVAARRIRARGVAVDVISHDMSSMRDHDPRSLEIVRPWLGDHEVVGGTPGFYGWKRTSRFARRGFETVERWEVERGPYRSLYSRSMWPASHVLGALHRIRRPDCPWRAEFSDPLSHDVLGRLRGGERVDDDLSREIDTALAAAGFPAEPGWTLLQWIEHLPFALADEILFTNENQLAYMLQEIPDVALRERVRERALVIHHPQPDAELYGRSDVRLGTTEGAVDIGYFGAFYATRGLTEVVDAIEALSPDERRRVRLHAYVPDPDALAAELRERPLLAEVVTAHAYVPYLDFLALLPQFDCLLVNDYRTAGIHSRNPYLPSKVSDYRGSGTPLWAVVEPGSVLSGQEVEHRSELDDVEGARRVLADLARSAGQGSAG